MEAKRAFEIAGVEEEKTIEITGIIEETVIKITTANCYPNWHLHLLLIMENPINRFDRKSNGEEAMPRYPRSCPYRTIPMLKITFEPSECS